jgi:hypothetical protein
MFGKNFIFQSKKNRILMELDLSHNDFGEESGKILGTFIGSFDDMKNLIMSMSKI